MELALNLCPSVPPGSGLRRETTSSVQVVYCTGTYTAFASGWVTAIGLSYQLRARRDVAFNNDLKLLERKAR